MNKKTAYKKFIVQLENFLQVYYNPGDVVSTHFLRQELTEQYRHPVHEAYQEFVSLCNRRGGNWHLTDYSNRIASAMKYCEGFYTKTVRGTHKEGWLKGQPYTQKRNYIKVPGTPRVPMTKTSETPISNFLLLA